MWFQKSGLAGSVGWDGFGSAGLGEKHIMEEGVGPLVPVCIC